MMTLSLPTSSWTISHNLLIGCYSDCSIRRCCLAKYSQSCDASSWKEPQSPFIVFCMPLQLHLACEQSLDHYMRPQSLVIHQGLHNAVQIPSSVTTDLFVACAGGNAAPRGLAQSGLGHKWGARPSQPILQVSALSRSPSGGTDLLSIGNTTGRTKNVLLSYSRHPRRWSSAQT